MTASVPGSTIDPDNPDPNNHPGLVSPAVLYMAGEDAPNGRVIQAMGGRFASNVMYSNEPVELGLDAVDLFEDNVEQILDMGNAQPGGNFQSSND